MNITGGTNLSLYEVNEAADIVATAADEEVNMIFGSVIREELDDEIVVTVIATGFEENNASSSGSASREDLFTRRRQSSENDGTAQARDHHDESVKPVVQPSSRRSRSVIDDEDTLDIPTFLRNRRRRNE
ncbi:cell division protein FtsZ [Sporolactobacillus inulinus]|nr:cell division protein FtsZ [Sporolactobacillus inulinus]